MGQLVISLTITGISEDDSKAVITYLIAAGAQLPTGATLSPPVGNYQSSVTG